MKANEAPEKIWMDLEWIPHFDCKDCITDDSIEYVRTDVFIEKACEFWKDHLEGYDIFGSDIERSIESFKMAMEL